MAAVRASTIRRISSRSSAVVKPQAGGEALLNRGVAAGTAEDEQDGRQQTLPVQPLHHLRPVRPERPPRPRPVTPAAARPAVQAA